MVAPSGTPPELVQRLNAEFAAVATMPEVRGQLDAYALVVSAENPGRAATFIQDDIKRWSEVVKTAKITTE